MYNAETKNQFIELRAEGLSLDTISSQLNVPRATLGRWHHQFIEQIQRLRSLQWHLLEEQIGHRLEDSLQRVAQRIRKWEDELDTRDPHCRTTVELLRMIRDSRRDYLQLRALLLDPLQPTRARAACLASLDQPIRDKTRQNPNALDTTSLPTNDLQQPQPAASHPDTDTNERNTSGGTNSLMVTRLQRVEPELPVVDTTAPAVCPHPPSAQSEISNVKFEIPSAAESPVSITASSRSHALPLPGGEEQTGSICSPAQSSGNNSNPIRPKKHKPYWFNGHYYQNPEYPEHIARALRGHLVLHSQHK